MANHLNTTYSFNIEQYDVDPPYVVNRDPAPSSSGNPEDTNVEFDVLDADEGVDLSSVDVSVTIVGNPASVAILGGVIQPGWSGSITPIGNGYHIDITPDLEFGSAHTMEVSIDAQDLAPTPNVMPTVEYDFSTAFQQPTCSLAECRIASLLGSIIQLDGRASKSPDGASLTYQWKFIQVPLGSIFTPDLNVINPSSIKDLRPNSRAAVSFIPDKLGDYVIELKVLAGGVSSGGCTALVEIGLSRALCGSGKVPDASFMWSFLSNFWSLVEDRQYFPTIWSGQLQLIGAEIIKLWSNDYSKSLSTVQNTIQRRWQRFALHTELSDNVQRLIVGNTKEGISGFTGDIGAPGSTTTKILYTTLANEDFTEIDLNYGAKGRIIDINGSAFTIERVYNTTVVLVDYSVVVVDEDAIVDNQSNIPYRIPHLLHIPQLDLEYEGAEVGDTLVLEWTRGDAGLTAEMSVRVVAVDRERIGFEFTINELDPGDPTIDYDLFEKLVQDLKIVSPASSDIEIAAAANALIAFVPTGINLSNRPFSVFQITVKASKLIHNSRLKINDLFVSIPYLQENVQDNPPSILRENFDYSIENGYLVFTPSLFTANSPSPEELWAECTHIDNSDVIEQNFGSLVELKKDDLTTKATRAPYLAAIKGLWFALTNGPTISNVRLGLQILMGLPFSESRGKILDITNNFSVDSFAQPIGRILAEDVDDEGRGLGVRRFYFFPENVGIEDNALTGQPYQIGEIIEAFLPLSKGVEVTDYVKNPRWWLQSLAGAEIKKFFIFKAQIDTASGVFDEKDLVFSLEFIRKIKPVYTNVVAVVLRALDDDILADFEDDIVDSKHVLRFYDNVGAFGAHESSVRANDYNHQGVVLWRGDSRPFSTRSLHTLRDIVTVQNLTEVRASSASGLGSVRARVVGDSSNPFIEGDILVIHPGQPGSALLSPKMYEITSVALPNGPAVLGNEVSAAEPDSMTVIAPDASTFSYGTDIVASIVRRAVNPVLRGSDLQTASGSIQLANSTGAYFKTNGVELDDHLVIESGANQGEYRICSIVAQTSPRDYTPAGAPRISETQVGLVALDGTNPILANLSNQVFRVIRPSMMRVRVHNAKIIQTAGNMHASVVDSVTGFPFDTFTPGMVGQELVVQEAENVLNNGVYTIVEYINAGNVRITTGSPQTSDTLAQAIITIRSQYHPGFEKAEELAPTEILIAEIEGIALLSYGSSTLTGVLTGIGTLSGTSAGSSVVTGYVLGAMLGSTAGIGTALGTLLGVGVLIGSSIGLSSVTGTFAVLVGSSYGSSVALATPIILTASSSGASSADGTLVGVGILNGSSAGSSTVSGTLT